MSVPSAPEDTVVTLQIPSAGLNIETFTSYEYSSHFLTPTDGWSFTVGDAELVGNIVKTITPGTHVTMSINGHTQGDGYVDGLEIATSRSGGTEITIHGRDRLAMAVDACADPRLKLTASQTLYDVIKAIFTPFGWSQDTQYLVANDDNRNVISGAQTGVKTSKKGKPLKSYLIHQLKPYPGEGCFAFAARIAQRFGLWIWPSAEGGFLILSRPDFDQQPTHKLSQKRGPQEIYNNMLSSHVSIDIADQPSCIIATGFGTGGENAVGQFSLGVRNPAILTDITAVLNAYPNTLFIGWPDKPWIPAPIPQPYARPLFLHDDESKTIDELTNFLRREISLRVRKTLTYHAEVEGHGASLSSGSSGAGDIHVWTVDTMVDVDDDVANIHEPLWVMGRTFTKSRDGGTKTRLELIRPHSIEF